MTKMTEQRDFVVWKLLAPLDVERAAAKMEFSLYSSDSSELASMTQLHIENLRMKVAMGEIRADPDKKRQYGMLVSNKVSGCIARFVFPKSSTERNNDFPLVRRSWHEKHKCLVDQDSRAQITEGNFKMKILPVNIYAKLGKTNPSPRDQCNQSSEEEVATISTYLSKNFPRRHLCASKGSR